MCITTSGAASLIAAAVASASRMSTRRSLTSWSANLARVEEAAFGGIEREPGYLMAAAE